VIRKHARQRMRGDLKRKPPSPKTSPKIADLGLLFSVTYIRYKISHKTSVLWDDFS